MTLTEFLRARLDEDEQAARTAGRVTWPSGTMRPDEEDFLNRFHDERVLAEVEAKRRIVGMHSPTTLNRRVDGEVRDITACAYDTDPDGAGWTDYPCETLRILASVYADHPDYDPAWRP